MEVIHTDCGMTGTKLFQRVNTSFCRQGLMQLFGARLEKVAAGSCSIVIPYSDRVTQQQGTFHGGVVGALADIAAGYAGLTVMPEGVEVVTVEYKINFLTACQGGEIIGHGTVIKAGKRVVITKAEVFHVEGREETPKLCATMLQTLMPVNKTY